MISSEKILELGMYSDLCGDELGELCRLLIGVGRRTDYALTSGLAAAIEDEIDAQLENFKRNATIVEREETRTDTYEELKWNEEPTDPEPKSDPEPGLHTLEETQALWNERNKR